MCSRAILIPRIGLADPWCQKHITGDEKGQAQIFLDRLFQAFGQAGCLNVGGTTAFGRSAYDRSGSSNQVVRGVPG
jgi:hypothetical protein